jgi:hypothetical protein
VTKPSTHFYRDVLHISVSSSRRTGNVILLGDSSSIGVELFHPGCNFQHRRQYTASVSHSQRVSSLLVRKYIHTL